MNRRFSQSRVVLSVILCLAWFTLIFAFTYPLRNTVIKLGMLLAITIIWCCVFCLSFSKRKLRYTLLGVTGACIAFSCMPSRRISVDRLRDEYVRSLSRYESRPYQWGAENFLAVDCSGLIRQGYIDANFLYGLKTCNGALVREAALLWWDDASAKAMRDEYQGRTRRFIEAPSINDLDHSLIVPGDFAVTRNGIHCLAYLGEGRWIQADPAADQVVIDHVPVENSSWFRTPVYIMQWSTFDN